MFDLISIFSLAGWIYIFYAVIDYLGSKLLNFRLFKPRGIIKEILLISLIFVVFVALGFIEMRITGTSEWKEVGLFGNLAHAIWLGFLRFPLFYFYSLVLFLLILTTYQYVLEKSQKKKIIGLLGLLVSIIFISLSLGIADYRVALCQLSYKNIGKTIISPEYPMKDCAKKIALENNETELCGKFGDPSECYYKLGVKTNDISFCKKIEEEGEYEFYAVDCYCEIALNKNDSSLCKKCNNHMEIRRCFIKTANISSITKDAIKKGEPQFCLRGNNQEKIDKCYYDFIKFYYDNSVLYMDLDCYSTVLDTRGYKEGIMCYDFFAKSPRSERHKEYTKKHFIKLCDAIRDKSLRSDCYNFKKIDLPTDYNSEGQIIPF